MMIRFQHQLKAESHSCSTGHVIPVHALPELLFDPEPGLEYEGNGSANLVFCMSVSHHVGSRRSKYYKSALLKHFFIVLEILLRESGSADPYADLNPDPENLYGSDRTRNRNTYRYRTVLDTVKVQCGLKPHSGAPVRIPGESGHHGVGLHSGVAQALQVRLRHLDIRA